MGFHFDEIFHEHGLFSHDNIVQVRNSPRSSESSGDEESCYSSSESSSNKKNGSSGNDSSDDREVLEISNVWACPRHPEASPSRRGYKHHASYEYLIRSAALGCEICMLFAFGGTQRSSKKGSEFLELHVGADSCIPLLEAEAEAEDAKKQIYVAGRPLQQGRRGVSEIRLFCCEDICLDIGVFCYPGQWCPFPSS
jgi:hypothetical protein